MDPMNLILVEDEPAALAILENIIKKLPLTLNIVGKARNGLEAKELLKTHRHIDIVITDIKMPLMDGLELSEFIYQENRNVDIVILSGFQEFSFAQKAMQFGVEDYLLKPLMPEKMTQVLSKIAARRTSSNREQERRFLESCLKGNKQAGDNEWHKNYKMITLHLGSYNGLVVEDGHIEEKIALLETENIFVLSGRKKNEFVLIFLASLSLSEKIRQIQTVFHQVSFVMVYVGKHLTAHELNGTLIKMSRTIELHHRLGQQQSLNLESVGLNAMIQKASNDWYLLIESLEEDYLRGAWEVLEGKLQQFLTEKKEIASLTTLQIVDQANHLIGFFNGHLDPNYQINRNVIEDIIVSSVMLEDILQGFKELLAFFLEQVMQYPEKIDSYDFYLLIEAFMQENYSRGDLNLALISGHFGISTTSVNDLFKKYQQGTFKEVLLKLRMEQAVAKIRKDPVKSLKQIAEEVGYKDALYFSKVFKKQYGKSPSIFQEEIRDKHNPR